MKWIRKIHSWFGVLFAPTIIVFGLSGLLQMYGCHEGEAGDEPAGWIVRIAQLHMKQTIELPRKRAPAPPDAHAPAAAPADAHDAPPGPAPAGAPRASRSRPTTLPLRLFFTALCLGLIGSTLGGLFMAFTPKRDRKLVSVLLALGIVAPIVLMML